MSDYSAPGGLPRKVHLQDGQRWQYDGESWTVVALSGALIRLRGDVGGLMCIDPMELITHGDLESAIADGERPVGNYGPSVVAPTSAARAAARRLSIVKWLIDGQPPDSPEKSLPAFEQAVGTTKRAEVIAKETGIGVSTMLRWLRNYREGGVDGLVDRHRVPIERPLGNCPRDVAEVLYEVMSEQRTESRHTDTFLIGEIRNRYANRYQGRLAEVSDRSMRRYLQVFRQKFDMHLPKKTQRSNAYRPEGPYTTLKVARPFEVVEIDSSPLDVLVLNPYVHSTKKFLPMWLTAALDVYTRQLVAWRVTAGDPAGVDAALLLHDMLVPKTWDPAWGDQARWRYGIPEYLVIHGAERIKPLAGVPFGVPGAISADNGTIYTSEVMRSACAQLGIDLHFARTSTPTDKPHIERFFGTVATKFSQDLPGYRGSSIADRGSTETVEDEAILFPEEVEALFARWVAKDYHNSPHKGLPVNGLRGDHLTPNEAFDRAIAIAGFYALPTAPDLAVGLLPACERKVRREGIEVNGLFYDSDDLNPYRDVKSPYPELRYKWPVRFDPRDLSWVWFLEPDDLDPTYARWLPIPCRVAHGERPFADVELKWAKRRLQNAGYDLQSGASVTPLEIELERVLDRIEQGEPESIDEAEAAGLGRYRVRQAAKDGLHRPHHSSIDDTPGNSAHDDTEVHDRRQSEATDRDDSRADVEVRSVAVANGETAQEFVSASERDREGLLRPTVPVSSEVFFAQMAAREDGQPRSST